MSRLSVGRLGRLSKILPVIMAGSIAGLILVASPRAGASQSRSQLQAQAQSLTDQIASQSRQIHQYAVEATAARAQLIDAGVRVQASERRLTADQARLADAKKMLTQIALEEFTQGSNASALAWTLASNSSELVARMEYEKVMGLDVNSAIYNYQRSMVAENQAAQAALAAQDAAQQAQDRISASQSSLESLVSQEQSSLSSVSGQIATLVQQELALQLERSRPVFAPPPVTRPQGTPSSSGIRSVANGSAGVGNWGGMPAPPSSAAFAALRQCESSGNYATNTGNGYYGAYQFALQTWLGLGFTGLPSNASPSTQDLAAKMEQQRAGWYAWPVCSMVLGLV